MFVSVTTLTERKKRKRGLLRFYSRFLIAQKATISTTAIMASSVVVKANAAVGSSVSIGCAADGAGSIVM